MGDGVNKPMKDSMDATAARQAQDTASEEFVSRKLIRPSLSSPAPRTEPVSERRERLERTDACHPTARVEQSFRTNARGKLLLPETDSGQNPCGAGAQGRRQVQGVIEWYDKSCIKVNRPSGSNLLIYKPAIRYIYKAGEETSKP